MYYICQNAKNKNKNKIDCQIVPKSLKSMLKLRLLKRCILLIDKLVKLNSWAS